MRFKDGTLCKTKAKTQLYKEMQLAIPYLTKYWLRDTSDKEESFRDPSSDHPQVSWSPSKILSNDQYRNEQLRIEVAKRWKDVKNALGWPGVLFYELIPRKWFNVTKVSKEDWNHFILQLLTAKPNVDFVIRKELPDVAPILLSEICSIDLLFQVE